MRTLNPWLLLGVGFVLVMTGAILPILMVMQIIPSTFFLNFFSYGASVAGVMLGIIGSAYYAGIHRRRRK